MGYNYYSYKIHILERGSHKLIEIDFIDFKDQGQFG